MDAALGIAGSASREAAGAFLCPSEFDADFFMKIKHTGGPVDVWAVDGVEEEELVTSGNGFSYHPARVAADQLTLLGLAVEEKRSACHKANRRRAG